MLHYSFDFFMFHWCTFVQWCTTNAHLLKTSTTHKKKKIPLQYVPINSFTSPSARNIIHKRKSNFTFYSIDCFSRLFISQLLVSCNLFLTVPSAAPASFFLKQFMNHRSKSFSLSFVIWITCNIKCFIRKYFVKRSSFW